MKYSWKGHKDRNRHKTTSCDSTHEVRMRYGSGSGDGKNLEHGKYECLIPVMRCGSGTACGNVAHFFSTPWSDSCHCRKASAAESERGLPSRQFSFKIFGLLSTATEVSKSQQPWWRTITKNWTLVVWGCDMHRVQTFATKRVAFFWIFFSIFSLVGEV